MRDRLTTEEEDVLRAALNDMFSPTFSALACLFAKTDELSREVDEYTRRVREFEKAFLIDDMYNVLLLVPFEIERRVRDLVLEDLKSIGEYKEYMPFDSIVLRKYKDAHRATAVSHDDFETACSRWAKLSQDIGWHDDRLLLGVMQSLKEHGEPFDDLPLNTEESLTAAEQVVHKWYSDVGDKDARDKQTEQALHLIGVLRKLNNLQ